ncbi:MAG: heme o synthase [Verrucomicrobiota bacterium]|nr:heme o synthase [Verrucomicrobiota bacterium]
MIKTYYMLTKPGIIAGNLLTTGGAFALASRGEFDFWLFLFTLLGLSFVIASACVFNNAIDRHADAKMARTKHRPLAQGVISPREASLFAFFLSVLGFFFLGVYTNVLTVLIAAIGFVIYVGMYSFWKYRSTYGTLIGSLSGATPPLIGYCAVRGELDLGALLLFATLVFWQMPHFYAIAMYRREDYTTAKIPVLPIIKGNRVAKIHSILYIVAFLATALLLTLCGYTGYGYLIGLAPLGLYWLFLGIRGFKATNDHDWARNMFRFSLVVITAFSVLIAVS